MVLTLANNEKLRIRLDLKYNGANFHGWAAQPGLRTVEGELSAALAQICRIADPHGILTVAGRTDAGVHAREQVAHFDLARSVWETLPGRATRTPTQALLQKLNAILATRTPGAKDYSDIVVYHAQIVPIEFDARFSALWRAYTYRIADGITNWDPLRQDVLRVPHALDLSAMNQAAQALLGEHDFLSFCKPRPGASTVRTLQEFYFTREGEGQTLSAANAASEIICAHVRADAFCHSQVRTLVGTLIEVGRGARGIDWPAQRLAARVRNGEVIVAPAHGLTLEAIGYPAAENYAAQAQLAKRFRGETDCSGA